MLVCLFFSQKKNSKYKSMLNEQLFAFLTLKRLSLIFCKSDNCLCSNKECTQEDRLQTLHTVNNMYHEHIWVDHHGHGQTRHTDNRQHSEKKQLLLQVDQIQQRSNKANGTRCFTGKSRNGDAKLLADGAKTRSQIGDSSACSTRPRQPQDG